MSRWIDDWRPDDETFWAQRGRRIAGRNLSFSIFAEFLGFSVWQLWAVVAVKLNDSGFSLSSGQLFTLVAVPGLVGATMRFPYTFAVPRFGGRNWTVVSALLLLLPCILLAILVQDPATPYWALLAAASTAGLGGGNFASSMANISFFYPEGRKGFALGLNAAGGNVGVAVVILVVPLVIGWGLLGGSTAQDGSQFLHNAGLVWIPFILAAALCAWLFMDNLSVSRSAFREQAVIVRRRHTWVMTVLYVGAFGSFIGYSAGFPLLIDSQFPDQAVALAFLGPLVGSIARPFGGWMSDRLGGARVTLVTFSAMGAATLSVIGFLSVRTEPWAFAGFLTCFLVLFVLSGIANGSTFRMVPAILRTHHRTLARGGDAADAEAADVAARREAAATLGFISAVAAYGGFLIPQSYGLAIGATGGPELALLAFCAYYACCVGTVWWFYLRRRFAVRRVPSLAEANV